MKNMESTTVFFQRKCNRIIFKHVILYDKNDEAKIDYWLFNYISICCFFLVTLYFLKYSLKCTNYIVNTTKIDSKIRIVQLTDLHNSTFGKEIKD